MNEDVKSTGVHIHSRADELIACLEGEIAKRDARIVELELEVSLRDQGLDRHVEYGAQLRAELAAIKAQDTVGEVVGWYRLDRPYEMTSYPSVCATWHRLGAPVAPLYAAPVQQASVPDGSRLVTTDWLKRIHRDLDACQKLIWANLRGCDPSYYEDAQERLREIDAMLAAAPAAPAADAVASLIEWTKDAVEWGGALNYAAWEFVNECPEKSALLFNNTKGPLRAAIMKYAEIVAANAKDSSHD